MQWQFIVCTGALTVSDTNQYVWPFSSHNISACGQHCLHPHLVLCAKHPGEGAQMATQYLWDIWCSRLPCTHCVLLLYHLQAMTRHVESPNLDMIERLAKENLEMQKKHQPWTWTACIYQLLMWRSMKTVLHVPIYLPVVVFLLHMSVCVHTINTGPVHF